MPTISSLLQWLSKYSKPILVPGKNIEVLFSPNHYFDAVKDGILKARRRVVVSSLYLGTGTKEKEIVACFRKSLSDKSRKELKCTFLIDHLRGFRGRPNSCSMVRKLVMDHFDRFTFGLYHTPNLRGYLKEYGPERFKEVMGLQHMKIFVSDDDVLLTGANMSNDYFVNRQDRYILFKDCKDLADLFSDLVNSATDLSFTLSPYKTIRPPSALNFDPLYSRVAAKTYKLTFGERIRELTEPSSQEPPSLEGDLDTVVFPLVQMGFCGIRQDETVTKKLFDDLDYDESLYLASGYFNLPSVYADALLQNHGACNILAASPQANGFYGAKGVAGHVPSMYTHFAKKFLKRVMKTENQDRVKYLEYFRPGWTFHGKGLWYYLAGESHPSMTLIGSSNYGWRSLTRDLEAQVALVTSNSGLKAKLHEERVRMFNYSRDMDLKCIKSDPQRRLTLLEWIATSFLKRHV